MNILPPWASPLAIVSVALGLALIGLWAQHQEVKRYKAEASSAIDTVKQLTQTLTDANTVAKVCDEGTKALEATVAAQKADANTAAANLRTLGDQLLATRKQLSAKEALDHADPKCEALLRGDLSACPNFLDGMRKRAHSGIPRSGDSSPRPD